MLRRFIDHVRSNKLALPGERVVVAYSGGADSTCLVTLFAESRAELGVEVCAAHLHHGQRPEADDEEAHCAEYCDSLGVPFVAGRADVPAMARLLGLTIEEAGRQARYTFLARAARTLMAHKVATGHTEDDHVETVLVNLARGTGLAGLAGIPSRRDEIVRPLLGFTRQATRSFCQERGLWFHDDPANRDPRHLRTRIRTELIPLMQDIDGRFRPGVLRLASVAAEEDAFLDQAAGAHLQACEVPLNGPLRFLTAHLEARFDRGQVTHAPPVLVKRAVRLAAEFVGGKLDHHQTNVVYDGLMARPRGCVTSEGGGALLEWGRESLHVSSTQAEEAFRQPFAVPGDLESEVFGYRLRATSTDGVGDDKTNMCVGLDRSKLKGGLHVRSCAPGDKMVPLGMEGSKKVSDLMQEKRLTSLARRRLPIICDMAGPVWVPGCAVAGRVSTDLGTVQTLCLELEPLGVPGRQDT